MSALRQARLGDRGSTGTGHSADYRRPRRPRRPLTSCLVVAMLAMSANSSSAHPPTQELQREAKPNSAQAIVFPAEETPVRLFNGKDLSGWKGKTGSYWTVTDGMIRGANEMPVPASTYLWTQEPYREFRLLLRVKQTRGPTYSTMHSAVAALGDVMTDQGDPFGFRGPLLMFCNDWGIWDAHRRNRVFPAVKQVNAWRQRIIQEHEQVGKWNLIEILVRGNRLRMAVNGVEVMDFTDEPEYLKAGPIGLQLHSNRQAQEFFFRDIFVSVPQRDELITVKPAKDKGN